VAEIGKAAASLSRSKAARRPIGASSGAKIRVKDSVNLEISREKL
jgi:hypothetical protein